MVSKLQKIERYTNEYIAKGDNTHKEFCKAILNIIHGEDFESKWSAFCSRGMIMKRDFSFCETMAFNTLRRFENKRLGRFVTLRDIKNPKFKIPGLGKEGRDRVMGNPEKFLWDYS